MKVSLRWLSEYIDLPASDPEELAEVFTMLGHEVEGIERLTPGWTGVVVGRVIEVEAHPRADRIRVCQVDTGSGADQIVCGAWNFDAGVFVPVALPGALLPGDFSVSVREIRGVVSHGMICSESELGLGLDHAGILVLDDAAELGRPFEELVELPDVVLDVAIGPNRPDAMSMVGLARDLAAHYDVDFRIPDTEPASMTSGATSLEVVIDDPEGCRRFTARELRDVTVGPSPMWLRHRLHKSGIRSISNVVDVTNYVMLELGHPLHAFDADTIAGDRLEIRRAKEGETLVTLDGEARSLVPDDLIIYDAHGPTSMSGTMGGARSEVSATTTRVIMEAASWDPPTIMYMSRRHDLRSEASLRFERGVDPGLSDIANRRACRLVTEISGATVVDGFVDVFGLEVTPVTVELRVSDVNRLLGPGLESDHVSDILVRLGFEVSGADPMSVTVPTFRPDVTRPADLVEEVARIHGYDRFEATLPTGPAGGLDSNQRRLRRLHETLAGLGMYQGINLPFVSASDLVALGHSGDPAALLTVKNPLREEESRLRPSMLPGLLDALRRNLAYGQGSVWLFETGRVFSVEPDDQDPRLPRQDRRLAWVVYGPLSPDSNAVGDATTSLAVWRTLAKALGVGGTLVPAQPPGYHPGRAAAVEIGGIVTGHVGELSPRAARSWEIPGRVGIAELDLDPLLEAVPNVSATTPSPFPHVDFDLSFRIDQTALAGQLVRATAEAAGDLLEAVRLFDEFRGETIGEGKRAVAIRYRLRAPDRTLAGEEVGAVRQAMIDAASALGAELRGA